MSARGIIDIYRVCVGCTVVLDYAWIDGGIVCYIYAEAGMAANNVLGGSKGGGGVAT